MPKFAAPRFSALCVASGLIIGGCGGSGAQAPTALRKTPEALKEVELLDGIYLARLESRTTITPDGRLRQVRIENKGGSPGISGVRVERREGRLTHQQMAELASLFEGWGSLSTERYGGVPDGGHIRLRYGDKTVSGGTAVPKQVLDVRLHIHDLAATMPIVELSSNAIGGPTTSDSGG